MRYSWLIIKEQNEKLEERGYKFQPEWKEEIRQTAT